MDVWRRFLSLLLTAALILGAFPGTALAEGCHDRHDEYCGYQESRPGVPCDHVCDESCVSCAHICDEGCAEGCAHVCDESCTGCTHACPDGCAYEAATEGTPCAHECEVCSAVTVSSWTWVDPEENLEDGELSLPGVSEANAVDFDTVLEFLPAAVSTEFGELPVEFTCPDFPETATGGEYLFTATLPEGYILAGEAAPLTVKVILGGGALLAENEYTSGYWKYAIYVGSNLVGITGYTGSSTTVTVPSTLGGYPVNDIGAYVFSETTVKSVTIPSSVKKISSYAFRNADSLQTVTIQGPATIDTGAFYDCDALTTVDLGSTTQIGQDAFCGCTSLTSITIPSSVKSIGRYAFTASGLTSVTFSGSSLTSIGIYAFSSTLLTTITLPSSATLEDGRVFSNCRDLTSIKVSGGTKYKSVDGVLFSYNGKTLVSYPRARAGEVYQIPAGTTTVGPYAFLGYNSSTTNLNPGTMKYLKRVWFPPSITTLNDRAFDTTTSLKYCFCGNAPSIGNYPLGSGSVWYTEGRTGWSETFAYRSATPWPAEEHVTRVLETYPATCGAPGTVKKECTLCGFVATVEDPDSPATGDHTWKSLSYSQVYNFIQPTCTVCDLSHKVKLEAPADCTYTGQPIEAVLTGSIPEGVGTWTLTYTGSGLVDGKPVQPGNYRATLSWSNEWNSAKIYVNYDIVVATEAAPEAVIDYYYEQLWCLEPNGLYLIDGAEYTADQNGYMPLEQDWIGTTLTIVKKSTDPNVQDSAPQTLVVPDRPAAPEGIIAVAESVKGAGDGKLLNVDYSMDYRYDYSGWMMMPGDTLEHLKPGTYEVRYSSDGFKFASLSVFLTVEEGPLPTAGTPEAKLDFENEVLTGLTPEGSYEINGNDYTADENGRIPLEESWLGTQITVILKGEEGKTQDSAPCRVDLPARPQAPKDITAQAESVEYADDGKLLGVDPYMEYRIGSGSWTKIGGPTLEGLAPGTYEVRYKATKTTFASHSVSVTVEGGKIQVQLTHGDIPKQLWTGKALEPKPQLNFTRNGKTLSLEEGMDYTLTYKNNVNVGNATVTVAPAKGGNCHFSSVTLIFQIGYGAKISDVPKNSTVWLDGVAKTLDGDILWLEEPMNAFITSYSFHNAGAEDIHTVYPTGMTVWELRGIEVKRLEALDDALLYAGTSIRTTGNQGIRFITSVPRGMKSSLKKGLEGYTLVEYGTLLGWYAPGTDLIWGVNATSVAYSKDSGTDAIFAQTGTTVQFTGMLTDLDLDKSTRDLMARPYMVLEKDGKQIVLYGGQLVRSIGYVAIQNKNVFRKGTADYEFIWKIIAYAYPEIYEAEYGK